MASIRISVRDPSRFVGDAVESGHTPSWIHRGYQYGEGWNPEVITSGPTRKNDSTGNEYEEPSVLALLILGWSSSQPGSRRLRVGCMTQPESPEPDIDSLTQASAEFDISSSKWGILRFQPRQAEAKSPGTQSSLADKESKGCPNEDRRNGYLKACGCRSAFSSSSL